MDSKSTVEFYAVKLGSHLSNYRILAIAIILVGVGFLVKSLGPPVFTNGFENESIDKRVWQVDADSACRIETSAEQVREGAWALRVQAPEGLRCELVPRIYTAILGKFFREPFATERWYRFSIFVDDLGTSTGDEKLGDNTLVAQWHSSPDYFPKKEAGRGPPLALRIFDGKWAITYGWDARLKSKNGRLANNWHWVGPVETGRWMDWTFRVVWSHGSDGVTDIWRDSELVMSRSGPNTYNDLRGVYLKLGLYHPASDQTIYLDRVSIIDGLD